MCVYTYIVKDFIDFRFSICGRVVWYLFVSYNKCHCKNMTSINIMRQLLNFAWHPVMANFINNIQYLYKCVYKSTHE